VTLHSRLARISSSKQRFFGGVRRTGVGDSITQKERGIYAASRREGNQSTGKFERFLRWKLKRRKRRGPRRRGSHAFAAVSRRQRFFGGVRRTGVGDSITQRERGLYAASRREGNQSTG